MSDFLFDSGDSDETEDPNWAAFSSDEDADETDPGVVAFLDQQTAEFQAAQESFANRYGFTHDCHCDKDYSSGNMVEVTECYAQMTVDALAACATLKSENTLLRNLITAAIGDTVDEGTDDSPDLADGYR